MGNVAKTPTALGCEAQPGDAPVEVTPGATPEHGMAAGRGGHQEAVLSRE